MQLTVYPSTIRFLTSFVPGYLTLRLVLARLTHSLTSMADSVSLLCASGGFLSSLAASPRPVGFKVSFSPCFQVLPFVCGLKLLWLLLTPRIFLRGLPEYHTPAFTLMPAASTSVPPVQVLDFRDIGLLIRYVRLICGFCSSGQRFAFGFLRIPPHGGHPCH